MVQKINDLVAGLGAELASPEVVPAIDHAIQILMNLRKVAVQLHGEVAPAPDISLDPVVTKRVPAPEPPQRPPRNYQKFDGSIDSLAHWYLNDPHSTVHKTRHVTKRTYEKLTKRIVEDMGDRQISEINARVVLDQHKAWIEDGRVALGHALIRMLRSHLVYGATILEDPECQRLCAVLPKMRFEMARPRVGSSMTKQQANLIRAKAHEMGYHSIALAQAFQFELGLRQKDVIGEWVPISEPGDSDVIFEDKKWLRGLRWEEIDDSFVLRHITSKGQKLVEQSLKKCPMILEELAAWPKLPKRGPIIMYENANKPWSPEYFRERWRKIATLCGVPKNVRNADSRNTRVASNEGDVTEAEAEMDLAAELGERPTLPH